MKRKKDTNYTAEMIVWFASEEDMMAGRAELRRCQSHRRARDKCRRAHVAEWEAKAPLGPREVALIADERWHEFKSPEEAQADGDSDGWWCGYKISDSGWGNEFGADDVIFGWLVPYLEEKPVKV